MVDKQNKEKIDLLCTACEMAVVWIETQLRMNKTKETILKYADEVVLFGLSQLPHF